MIDFTSALYLGFKHESWRLRPWFRLTTGAPAALRPVPGAATLERELAQLVGSDASTLGTSTLHLFWDLLGSWSRRRISIFFDRALYPVGRWGVERAVSRGVPAQAFFHRDAEDLRHRLQSGLGGGRTPVVIADGICGCCQGPIPVREYAEAVRECGGYLLLDDTQALGILGVAPTLNECYGWGGGGSLRYHSLGGDDIVVIASLAKGFGAPVAMLAGSKDVVGNFVEQSETRVHSSPPSVAVVQAAGHALVLNRRCGDALRRRLESLVRYFRRRVPVTGGLFPVQAVACGNAGRMYDGLLEQGVRTVLHQACVGRGATLSFLITARHREAEIELAAAAVHRVGCVPRGPVRTSTCGEVIYEQSIHFRSR